MLEKLEVVDELFESWREPLGEAWGPYRGHVYRMLNFSLELLSTEGESLKSYGEGEEWIDILGIAAAFHDVGIWLDDTWDYLAPSRVHAADYLKEQGKEDWTEAVELIIEWHHKQTRYRGPHEILVENFRRGDLIDVSLGVIRFGIPRATTKEIQKAFANLGFHMMLVKGLGVYGLKHPWKPLPMFRA